MISCWSSPPFPDPLPRWGRGNSGSGRKRLSTSGVCYCTGIAGGVLPASTSLTEAFPWRVPAYADEVIEVMAMSMPGITKKTPKT